MSARRIYTQETVDAVSKQFDAAPAIPTTTTYSTFSLVRKLAPKIRAMIQHGYTWDAIAGMMADQGVKLSSHALRKYVAQSQGKKTSESPPGRGKQRDTSKPTRNAASTATARQAPPTAPSPNESSASDEEWDNLKFVAEPHKDTSIAGTRPARPQRLLPHRPIEPSKVTRGAAKDEHRGWFPVRPDSEEI